MSMTEKNRRALERCRVDLVKDVEPNDVMDYLISDGILVPDDVEAIGNCQSRKDKVRLLLDMISRRGNQAFDSFLKALADKNSGHSHLYDLIIEKLGVVDSCDGHASSEQPASSVQPGIQCTQPHSMNSPDANIAPGTSLHQSSRPGFDYAEVLRETPINPSKILTDKLLGQLATKISSHWEELASLLGLGPNVVYRCKQENQFNLWAQIYSMLITWKNKEYRNATIGRLVQVLNGMNISPADYSFLLEA